MAEKPKKIRRRTQRQILMAKLLDVAARLSKLEEKDIMRPARLSDVSTLSLVRELNRRARK